MKKMALLLVSIFLFVSCGKEKQFDRNLQDAYVHMGKTMIVSAFVCEKTINAWHQAIFKNKTPSGKYCSDFNEAITEQFEEYKKEGVLDSLYIFKNNMEVATAKLNNPPSNRKDCYNDFIDIVSEVSSFSRMAVDPSGSYRTYSDQINGATENISKKIDQFKIKYAEYIKFGEE